MEQRWVVIRHTWSTVKRHILFVNSYSDIYDVDCSTMENIEFIVFQGPVPICDINKYKIKFIVCEDVMRDFRNVFKNTFKLSYLGHIFAIATNPATYKLLDEWLVCDINQVNDITLSNSIYFTPPHVVVFDMDSTLITEEENVRIRDESIYDGLKELKQLNCVLCLWSYGDREHVVDSLNKLNLYCYFDIVLAEGKRKGEYNIAEEIDDYYDVFYQSTPFYLDVTDVKNIPKSPRVVLWYLQKRNINFIKTITLVDDLFENNINYDNFVNLKTCPVPVDDWHKWHQQIVHYIQTYNNKL
ncbi:ORF_74 [Adoxophyes orana granulovirus]|uniref:38K protein n=1 Tax=Adoxophyes orana granulovirus TaxID=170617 RepID=Q7T9U1_GVAO|nr:ORF_74 [Adoxophyes orana granulovirus]AAP85711.1 ORF_74 [Adoxophyes orana granulovirus]AJA91714.1 38K protein [Adoxophyes orana granulovirus]